MKSLGTKLREGFASGFATGFQGRAVTAVGGGSVEVLMFLLWLDLQDENERKKLQPLSFLELFERIDSMVSQNLLYTFRNMGLIQ